MVDIDSMARSLLLRLRHLPDEIEGLDSFSSLEVMWNIRTHTCNQPEMPQAIFRVGDQLASVLYLEDLHCWELQLDGDEHLFDTFEGVTGFIEQRRLKVLGIVGQDGN